ncbi:MAG: hypothetical protein LCH95_24580, partial [Proteobacteria bacterium]|nr:hypothetical protein [Pseudomonadota bacterium]
MTRRRLVAAAAGMGVAPAVARAQRVRVVGVLLSQAQGTPEAVSRVTALRDGLLRYGWVEGQNLRLDVRYGDGTPERLRQE